MKALYVLIPVGLIAAIWGVWMWFFCRVQVPAGHMAVITAKVGEELPEGQILAERNQKGIWKDPLPEGRYFFNPINYSCKIVKALTIPVGKVAMVTSRVGRELPAGEILAANSTDSKGVWRDVLGPGVYRLNPFGYQTTLLDAVNIPIGYVGVVTSQTGKPVATGSFAGPGEQGVMKDVLQPGLYYINPKAYQVDVMEIGMNQVTIVGQAGSVVVTKGQISNAATALDELQLSTLNQQQQRRDEYISQNYQQGFVAQKELTKSKSAASSRSASSRLGSSSRASTSKMSGVMASRAPAASMADQVEALYEVQSDEKSAVILPESAAFALQRFVEFPSRDGFQIMLDMTVEFELLPENISRVYMLYGDLPAVVEKIILPQILSISRLKGSSYKARDFIDGEGRQVFQQQMNEELVRVLKEKHILVHNAIIRHVEIPFEILTPIRDSSKAKEQDLTNQARQDTARKQAELNTQTALIDQSRSQVEQETAKLVATVTAETRRDVASLQAEAEREVSALNLEKARIQADITEIRGKADVDAVFLVDNERAQGQKLKGAVFKDTAHLAQLQLIENLSPELDIRVLHAGPGTLWTDMKSLMPSIPVKAQ